ncbi:helix-turn-helix domain-containing protein [Paenibacillus soyae]|uniref:Helix-turn-helix domain-containing protein n=1 Tax=Paenibacillus soyae TaxID=2969249 RepID=A0A9X2MR68_9BACL|nr:helix-turn-helix transcriptional regulator [Paenibacillus soyae]MCR2804271.1 helix-turn-helix domain-containing protein [Paenibacillus soyae]
MKLNIGSKITNLRKEKSITQEQLANAVGVSIAAVSKWECGNTYPDISLLPEIASFFTVSVDALLDYKVEPKNAQDYRDRLKEITIVHDFHTGLPLAEEALKKYPNDFEILLQMGHLTFSQGTSSDSPDRETVLKSIDYFNKALSVQTSDSTIKKEYIEQIIAFAYDSIREFDKAIAILEKNNTKGCFDPEIANFMMKKGDIREAKSKLQHYLWHTAFGFGMVTEPLKKCFRKENNLHYVVALQKLHATFLQSFIHETPNYCDLICSWSFMDLAESQAEIEDTEGMWDSIKQSVYHSVRFDQNPSYSMESIKFMEDSKGMMGNNSSQNACQGTINRLKKVFPQYQSDERMIAFIQDLETAATDKVHTGIWK